MEELVYNYFPSVSDKQRVQFSSLYSWYKIWNEKINVVSRKDFENLYIHHVLHSLAIAKFIEFPSCSSVLDLGTGGGFPGVPLAIMFPDVSFYLCDSVAKKIEVVKGVSSSISLKNVTTLNQRAEEVSDSYDFIVTRAVAQLDELLSWSSHLLKKGEYKGIARGLISLKGGDLKTEISRAIKTFRIPEDKISIFPVSTWFDYPWFDQKYLIFIPADYINICR